jgi:hypothetical protein
MKNILNSFIYVAALSVLPVFAEPSGDRPNATHAWSVHDPNRPDPVKVETKEGKPPSDAKVLFDGTEKCFKENWRGPKGKVPGWKVADGIVTCVPSAGGVRTVEAFGDCQLHLEWKIEKGPDRNFGNSGVIFLDNLYEIQILESSNVAPSRSPWKAANYADGQAGSVYGQNPPMVQPCRKPGEWQTYDIIFHPPIYDGKRLVDPGSATVFFNGVLVQDCFPFQGHTGWCRRYGHASKSSGTIMLQNHGSPVSFRNIWIRSIPSRFADTVNGGLGLKMGDVAALRHKLAGESLALAGKTADVAEKYIRLWESFCYEPDRKTEKMIKALEADCIKAYKERKGTMADNAKRAAFQRFINMLVSGKWISANSPIKKML